MRQVRAADDKGISTAAEIIGAILGALVAVAIVRLDLVGRLAAWIAS